MKYARRTKIGRFYVQRKKNGQIKKWTSIGKSLKYDRRVKSKTRPKRRGRGNKGDY